MVKEKFDYTKLDSSGSTYKDFIFKQVIFCEGIGVKDNPFFSDISVNPNKGHHIKVKLSQPIPESITIKKKHFLFPTGNGLYFMGELMTGSSFTIILMSRQWRSWSMGFLNFILTILKWRKYILGSVLL